MGGCWSSGSVVEGPEGSDTLQKPVGHNQKLASVRLCCTRNKIQLCTDLYERLTDVFLKEGRVFTATKNAMRAEQKAVLGHDVFVVIVTPDFRRSHGCMSELNWAIESEKRVVPIMIGVTLSNDNLNLSCLEKFELIHHRPSSDTIQRVMSRLDAHLPHLKLHTEYTLGSLGYKARLKRLSRSKQRVMSKWLADIARAERVTPIPSLHTLNWLICMTEGVWTNNSPSRPTVNMMLYEAAQHGRVDRVRLLLELGADPSFVNPRFEKSAWEFTNHPKVISMLSGDFLRVRRDYSPTTLYQGDNHNTLSVEDDERKQN